MSIRITMAAAALAIGAVGCGSPGTDDRVTRNDASADAGVPTNAGAGNTQSVGARQAMAMLRTSGGAAAGTAIARETPEGIAVTVSALGLPPGRHGVHIHMTGRCDPPAFESAGGHWNPTDQQHGLMDPAGQHAGDMPNLEVRTDGAGTLDYTLAGGSFDGLLDDDGAALVVHADADDQQTDPSGNSGGRIACGLFESS